MGQSTNWSSRSDGCEREKLELTTEYRCMEKCRWGGQSLARRSLEQARSASPRRRAGTDAPYLFTSAANESRVQCNFSVLSLFHRHRTVRLRA